MTPKSLRYVLRKICKWKKEIIQLPSFSDFVAAYLNPSLVSVLAEIVNRHEQIKARILYCINIKMKYISRRNKNFIK
jgi:hypothetical protein